MSSTRNCLAILFAGASLFAGAGCQIEQRTPPPEPLNTKPLLVDVAMQRRDWDPSLATYSNDTVMAWPDYSPLRSHYMPCREGAVTDPILFFGNLFYMPVGMFKDPPTKMVGYKSLSVEPTYTAMPPLKPATQPSDFDVREK
jgi:hypothetical protein